MEASWLLRAVGIATDARKLLLAGIGLVLMSLGSTLLTSHSDRETIGAPLTAPIVLPRDDWGSWLSGLAVRVVEPAWVVVAPFTRLLGDDTPGRSWGMSALLAVWTLLVWSLFGGAIARVAVVQAATGEKPGFLTALRFALRKLPSLVGAPLIPFLAVAGLVAVNAVIGFLLRLPFAEPGPVPAAVLVLVPTLLAMVLALILLGLAFGWPLMHATIAAEDEDAADALSRSYSYVNQRFFRFAAHAGVALVIGVVGLFLAIQFGRFVGVLTASTTELLTRETPAGYRHRSAYRDGTIALVNLVLHAWVYSYFWSVVPLVYLAIRRDVDGAELHEIALPSHAADTFAGDLKPVTQRDELAD